MKAYLGDIELGGPAQLPGWRVVDYESWGATTPASVGLTVPAEPIALRALGYGLRSTDTSDTDRLVLMRMNGDSGGNYAHIRVGGSSNGTDTVTAAVAADDTGATAITLTPIPASQTNTTRTGLIVAEIDHHDEAAWKSVVARGYTKKSTNNQQQVFQAAGEWESTSRITSLTLLPSQGSWAAGGVFVLEGLYLPA